MAEVQPAKQTDPEKEILSNKVAMCSSTVLSVDGDIKNYLRPRRKTDLEEFFLTKRINSFSMTERFDASLSEANVSAVDR